MGKYSDDKIDMLLKQDAGMKKDVPAELKRAVMSEYESKKTRKPENPVWKTGLAAALSLALLSVIVFGIYRSAGKDNTGVNGSEKLSETSVGEGNEQNIMSGTEKTDSSVNNSERPDSVTPDSGKPVFDENENDPAKVETVEQKRYLEAAETEWFSKSENLIWTHGSIDKDYNITSEDGIYAELVIDRDGGNWFFDLRYSGFSGGIDYNENKGLGTFFSDPVLNQYFLRWMIYETSTNPKYSFISNETIVPVLEEMADYTENNYKAYLSDAIRTAANDIAKGEDYYCFVNMLNLYRVELDETIFDRKYCITGYNDRKEAVTIQDQYDFMGKTQGVSVIDDTDKKDIWMTKSVFNWISSEGRECSRIRYWQSNDGHVGIVLSEDSCTAGKGSFVLNNYSGADASFKKSFRLERMEDGKWFDTGKEAGAEIPVETLAKDREEKFELNWSDFGGTLSAGTYRLHMTVNGVDIWAEFTV